MYLYWTLTLTHWWWHNVYLNMALCGEFYYLSDYIEKIRMKRVCSFVFFSLPFNFVDVMVDFAVVASTTQIMNIIIIIFLLLGFSSCGRYGCTFKLARYNFAVTCCRRLKKNKYYACYGFCAYCVSGAWNQRTMYYRLQTADITIKMNNNNNGNVAVNCSLLIRNQYGISLKLFTVMLCGCYMFRLIFFSWNFFCFQLCHTKNPWTKQKGKLLLKREILVSAAFIIIIINLYGPHLHINKHTLFFVFGLGIYFGIPYF